jgi:hypothetical protein
MLLRVMGTRGNRLLNPGSYFETVSGLVNVPTPLSKGFLHVGLIDIMYMQIFCDSSSEVKLGPIPGSCCFLCR